WVVSGPLGGGSFARGGPSQVAQVDRGSALREDETRGSKAGAHRHSRCLGTSLEWKASCLLLAQVNNGARAGALRTSSLREHSTRLGLRGPAARTQIDRDHPRDGLQTRTHT